MNKALVISYVIIGLGLCVFLKVSPLEVVTWVIDWVYTLAIELQSAL